MKVLIEKIKFIKELYPRFELDNYTVNQYRQSVDRLPPILISRNYVLIDGYHRLIAHKLEGLMEIEIEIFDSDNEKEILVEAIKRNSTHGKQLSIEEKQRLSPKLYEMSFSVDDVSNILAVGKSKIYEWTKNIRDKEKEERNVEILELYLQCHSYREIGEKIGLSHTSVEKILMSVFSTNGKSLQPDNLQFYNVWNIGRLNQTQLKYPGQTPQEIVENVVYYYSDPPQFEPCLNLSKVVDPMAGSGVIRDACRKLLRRYMLFDLKPLREDIPIKQNDILKGLPKEAKSADLVYFDPPYFNLMSEYPDNEFNSSYKSFLGAMKKSLEHITLILNDGGKVALILKPMNEEMLGGNWLDMTFDSAIIAQKLGYKFIKRIAVPLSTQQFNAHDVTRAKERKVILNTLRDIIILEKCK